MKIALVDDNEKERSRLIEMLRAYGEKACGEAEIAEFASAEEFADAFSPGSFDVVFMDIYMEGLDGMAGRQAGIRVRPRLPHRFYDIKPGACRRKLRCRRSVLSCEACRRRKTQKGDRHGLRRARSGRIQH